jgi:hypothetical protein
MHLYNFLRGEPCRFDLEDGPHRGRLFQKAMGKEKWRVFKDGAKTGFTEGLMHDFLLDMEQARKDLLPDTTDITKTLNADRVLDASGLTAEDLKLMHWYRWVGVVEWVEGFKPFARKGDSGALVYAMKESAIVPLGIHIGYSSNYPNCSFSLALESFIIEGRLHGLDLHFPYT